MKPSSQAGLPSIYQMVGIAVKTLFVPTNGFQMITSVSCLPVCSSGTHVIGCLNALDPQPPKHGKGPDGAGFISVLLYSAKPGHSMNTSKFLERPRKARYTPLTHRLNHYAGMGLITKIEHPTRRTVGTVDNFQAGSAGTPVFAFHFGYHHSACI